MEKLLKEVAEHLDETEISTASLTMIRTCVAFLDPENIDGIHGLPYTYDQEVFHVGKESVFRLRIGTIDIQDLIDIHYGALEDSREDFFKTCCAMLYIDDKLTPNQIVFVLGSVVQRIAQINGMSVNVV